MPVEDLVDPALRAGHSREGEHHEERREGDHGDQRDGRSAGGVRRSADAGRGGRPAADRPATAP
ncbi:hypothetical protein [Streptomyces sp. NBC_01233]|uniref:hypothetical protein n=1 Tax=Streptomyces sp. NBC_01233 TaxID=2903787 RepID=UPI002E164E07|nr:hypothetical protein OG332_26905 [Streptomyces sp. NBC_01233]